jgi:hypothetical protein
MKVCSLKNLDNIGYHVKKNGMRMCGDEYFRSPSLHVGRMTLLSVQEPTLLGERRACWWKLQEGDKFGTNRRG